MDRTIPPGTPGGEDAGAVVGVVDPDSTGRNSTRDISKANPGRTHNLASKAIAVPEARTGVPVDARRDREGRTGKSSAVRAR